MRTEIVEATELIPANETAAREGDPSAVQRRPTPLPGNSAAHQVLFLPQLAEFLAHDAVTAVARETLDDHIRLAQFNTRPIRADEPDASIPWNRVRPVRYSCVIFVVIFRRPLDFRFCLLWAEFR